MQHEDGSISIIAFSEPSVQDVRPENKDSVRGELFLAGWYLQKVGEKETNVQLLQDIDLKGSIPKAAYNTANGIQADQLKKLPDVIAAYCKANGRA